MEPQKTDLRTSDVLKPKNTYEGVAVDEKGELVYEKSHQSLLYKIMKFNPIDPLNDLYRRAVAHWNFEKQESRLQWRAATVYIKLLARLLWRFEFESVDGTMFPEWGGGIVVSNHNSHLDPFFVGCACHRRIRWMSKPENFKTPIVRTLFKNLCAINMGERGNQFDLQRAMDEARETIREGGYIGIFPEGTRSKDETLGEFKTGAIRLAVEEGVPIVPMAVLNSRNALPKGKLFGKPVQVSVRLGKPIYYDQYKDKVTPDLVERLTSELRQEVQDLIDGKHNYSRRKKKEPKLEELSIGSPKDVEKTSKSKGIKGFFKYLGKSILTTIDDFWCALLRSLEEFGLKEQFQTAIFHFSQGLVDEVICANLAPYRKIGFENIPDVGPAVVCSNHNSEWDVIINPVAVGKEKRRVLTQMSKQVLFQIPIVNAWVRSHFAFPLKRGENDVQCFNYAKELLEEGHLVMVYPEGTTNSGGGELLEGHTGAVRLAIEGKVPIIPIGITGTENTYPKHAKMLTFGNGSIFNVGKPFMEHAKYFDKPMPDYDELKRLTNNMMNRIQDLMFYGKPDA